MNKHAQITPENKLNLLSACTNAIQDAFKDLPTVQNVNVSLLNNSMTITHDENGLNSVKIMDMIEDLGYEPSEWDEATRETTAAPEERQVQLIFQGLEGK